MKIYKVLMLLLLLPLMISGISSGEVNSNPSELDNSRMGWFELVTPDLEASKNFYSQLLGWEFKEIEKGGRKMAIVYHNGKPMAGVIEVKGANASVWIRAIAVKDLKETTAAIGKVGGKLVLNPAKIKDREMLALFEGPQGEEFAAVQYAGMDNQQSREEFEGCLVWSELWSSDPAAASAFYGGVFGLEVREDQFDDRPYWTFTKDQQPVAGMIGNPVTNQGSRWVPYVLHSNPADIIAKAVSLGGQALLTPTSEVRDAQVGILTDPHGAVVCVQSAR